MLEEIPGGPTAPTTWLGVAFGAVAAAGGAILWLRKFLSGDAVDRAANEAQTQIIEMQRAQIEKESARADKAEAALASALEQMSGLRKQIYALQEQVSKLQLQVDQIGGPHT